MTPIVVEPSKVAAVAPATIDTKTIRKRNTFFIAVLLRSICVVFIPGRTSCQDWVLIKAL